MNKWTASVGVAIAVALALWLLQPSEIPTHQIPEEFADLPDLIVDGAEFLEFRASGQPLYQLATTSAHQNTAHGIAKLTKPQLDYFTIDSSRWHVSSLSGTVHFPNGKNPEADEFVRLEDSVVVEIHRMDRGSLTILTEAIELYPERALARSSVPVTILAGTSQVQAPSLEIDLASNSFHLKGDSENQVHAILHPSKTD